MGLREKVTITLVIIALIQIACRHCMPRTPRKASLKRYLNDLKPVKNNPIPTPYSPSRVNKTPIQSFGKAAKNGKNSLPKQTLFKKYNFPDNEYPLDNSPRDPFHIGMNFNEKNHVNTLQKAHNLQSSAINVMKKEMKMKRKLLSNKQVNYGNSQLKTDMSSIKSVSNPDPTRWLGSETFPEVQYPLNTMDTWGPNYWNYLPFTQEKPFHRFEQQIFNSKPKEDINKPLTRLTKAKASKYLQPYDKLKEEHRRTSTENSKRSNLGQKGLNFTKTATCEKVSEDFMTAGLVSNIPPSNITSSVKITTSSENTCPVTEYPYYPMPLPYKVNEENIEKICPAYDPENNTKELQDVDNSDIAQTLQLIQEILFNDDTSSTVLPGNCSKEIEKNVYTSDYTVVSANKDISTTLNYSDISCTVSPTEELSQAVSEDAPAGYLRNKMTSLPAELIPENTTTVAGPLNVRMPIPFSEPITYDALTNALNPGSTLLSNGTAVPGSKSIIIIPFNNKAVGKSQMFGTSPDTPIIVYLPSTQSSDNPCLPWPSNQIVSSSIDKPMPNPNNHNVLSNMAPLQNDNPFSTTLASELLNCNSYSGSSLPIHETLPTNSICYINESSPSSMRGKPVSDILIDKSLTIDVPFVITTADENLSEQPTETGDLDVNTDTLPPISDFEHPLSDFSGSEYISLSHGPHNNILHNKLPITEREIDSDQQILNVSSTDLFIPPQNVTSEHLHKTTSIDNVSEDFLSEIPNDIPPVALDTKFLSVTPTDSIEILTTNTLLPESIPNSQEPMDSLTESLPQPIDNIFLSTPLIEPTSAKLPQPKESSLSLILNSEILSDKLPIIMDTKLPHALVSDITTDSTPQHIGNSPSSPMLNSSPMMTDMTLKTELYKMRQILDKMLATETPTYNQPPLIDTTLLPNSESGNLLLPKNESPTESVLLPETDSPIDSLRQLHEMLPPISVDGSPTATLPLPGHKLVIPNKLLQTDTPSLLIDDADPHTLVSVESFADNKPFVLDNLVTPLSETVTSRIKDTVDNSFSHKIDDFPLKMDLNIPNIYEVSSDDLPVTVDLPTQVHPEYRTNPEVSTNDFPTQVVETLPPVSEFPVRDLTKPTDVFSLPVDEVLEGASPNVMTDSVKLLISGSIDELLQDLPQKNHLSQTVQKLIPDLSLAHTNGPSLKDYSPSYVIDENIEFPYSNADTKDLPLVVEHLLSPENDVTADILVTDIPSAALQSTYLEDQQSTNLHKTSDEVLSESSLSDIRRDNLPLPEDKMLPLTDIKPNDLSLPINRTPSTSKLPITKALLENVLSYITKGDCSPEVTKALPVTPLSLLDKTLHHVDLKSPLSETKEIPLRPVEKIFPNSEPTDNLIEYVPIYKKLEDASITDLPLELPLLPMDEMHKDKPYIPTDDVENDDKNQTQSSNNPTHDLPVPIDKVSLLKDPTKTSSSSKLPITKSLLENVLSDITTKGLSVPVALSLPVASPSVLDKTVYYVESPISHVTEDSPSLPVDKILVNTYLSDHPTEIFSISTEDTLLSPLDKTYSELQSLHIPTKLSSPIDNIRADIPNISMYDKEQNESENLSSENLTDDLSSASPIEGILSLSKDTLSDLTLPNNKTPTSSKLPITKALLENVLSDINTRGFSLPLAKALPVVPRSQLDKTLYFLESTVTEMSEKSSVIPSDNFPPPGINEDVFRRPTDKTLPDNPMLFYISSNELLMDKDYNFDSVTDNPKSENIAVNIQNRDTSVSLTDYVEDDDEDKSDIWSDDVEANDKSVNLTDDVKDRDKSDITVNIQNRDTSVSLTDYVEDDDEDKSDIWSDDVEANDKSVNLTDDVEDRDKSENIAVNIQNRDTSVSLTDYVEDDDEDKSDIWSDDVEANDKSVNLTDDVKDRDKSDITVNIQNRDTSVSLTDYVEDDDEDKSDIWSEDVEANDKSVNLTDDVKDRHISGNLANDLEDEDEDTSDNLTDYVENDDEDKSNIWSDDVEDKDKSDNLTDDTENEDSNESRFSDGTIDDMPSDLPLRRTKPYLASRIPITKALLEKVLSDISDGGIHP